MPRALRTFPLQERVRQQMSRDGAMYPGVAVAAVRAVTKPPEPEKCAHDGTSDIALVDEAFREAEGNGLDRVLMARQIAMNQRVIAALEKFNAKSDQWSRRLFWATWALLAATLAIVILTLVLVLKS